MTIEEKIGQLIIFGFNGKKVTKELSLLIKKMHFGGVVLFERNFGDENEIRNLNMNLQKIALQSSSLPLFIAVDQEGGVVERLAGIVTSFPGNMALGKCKRRSWARKVGEIIGREISDLGFNWNFAPVLDVNTNQKNPVVGVRSFGENHILAGILGKEMIKGMKISGVLTTAKHFLGIGDVSYDPHSCNPVIRHSFKRLENRELIPFKEAIKAGVDSVMVSNVSYPEITHERIPACLSDRIVKDILKRKMRFNGIVITDDLEMGGIKEWGNIEDAGIRAILAGCDILLICSNEEKQIKTLEALVRAVKRKEISEDSINLSLNKIISVKNKIKMRMLKTNRMKSNTIFNQRIAREIAKESITVLRDRKKLIPLKKNEKISIITPEIEMERGINIGEYLSTQLNGNLMEFSLEKIDTEDLIAFANKSSTLLLGTYNAHLSREQILFVKKILGIQSNTVLVALRNPYDAEEFQDADCVVLTYGFRKPCLDALIDLLR